MGKVDVTAASKVPVDVIQFVPLYTAGGRETSTFYRREQRMKMMLWGKKLVQWMIEAAGKVQFTLAHTHTHARAYGRTHTELWGNSN